jgi:succinate-semialdehyde dehydrogenase/glutarate-semialdehyde dehydrogenase
VYEVIDPATGQVVGEYPTATDDQIDRALAAAAEAHCKWSRVSTAPGRAALEGAVSALHD